MNSSLCGEQKDISVMNRQYSEAHKRAMKVLDNNVHTRISCDHILYVLSALPQPKNTRRVGVIPDGESFVHSQAAGLTTQHGFKPSLSSLCLKCPLVLRVLSRFALDHDPLFQFTTVTLNYNYASAPHQDINHEGGRARIIGLGAYTGGGLNLQGIDSDIDIKNRWYDFDGRILHSTNPFRGERYSLVYFTHLVCREDATASLGLDTKLAALGIPFPFLEEKAGGGGGGRSSCVAQGVACCSNGTLPIAATTRSIHHQKDAKSRATITHTNNSGLRYLFLFDKQQQQHYRGAFRAEVESLVSLYSPTSECNRWHFQEQQQQQQHDILKEQYPITLDFDLQTNFSSTALCSCQSKTYHLPSPPPPVGGCSSSSSGSSSGGVTCSMTQSFVQQIANRAVTFSSWVEICRSNSLENLRSSLNETLTATADNYGANCCLARHRSAVYIPRHYNVEIFSFGKKLSTRQRRKILMSANLPPSAAAAPTTSVTPGPCTLSPSSSSSSPSSSSSSSSSRSDVASSKPTRPVYSKLGLVLVHNPLKKDDTGTYGQLETVSLCLLIPPSASSANRSASGTEETELTEKAASTKDYSSACAERQLSGRDQSNDIITINPATATSVATTTTTPATPLRAAQCQLVCNLAKIGEFSMCLDPFCGSGCLVDAAERLCGAAVCVGCDAQLTLHGSQNSRSSSCSSTGSSSRMSKISEQQQQQRDVFIGNVYHHPWVGDGRFDAIICDPPYGRRGKHIDARGNGSAVHSTNEERAWSQFQVLRPVMEAAAQLLRVGGRLVFLFVNFPLSETARWEAKDLPIVAGSGLSVLYVCREEWTYASGHTLARDTVVVEKTGVMIDPKLTKQEV